MPDQTTVVRKSYIDLRGLNLGTEFMRANNITAGRKFIFSIDGVPDADAQGTINSQGFISGLAVLYREFDLREGDPVAFRMDGNTIKLNPPTDRKKAVEVRDTEVQQTPARNQSVFERQSLRHIHLERYAPGNLGRWVPQSEPDVYMVFGALADKTDYRYCCGVNTALLQKLGYTAETKPDAVLIDAVTDQYLMAEFKMYSCDYSANHRAEDVDVLVCWIDNEKDRRKLPATVLALKDLLAKALDEGEIDL